MAQAVTYADNATVRVKATPKMIELTDKIPVESQAEIAISMIPLRYWSQANPIGAIGYEGPDNIEWTGDNLILKITFQRHLSFFAENKEIFDKLSNTSKDIKPYSCSQYIEYGKNRIILGVYTTPELLEIYKIWSRINPNITINEIAKFDGREERDGYNDLVKIKAYENDDVLSTFYADLSIRIPHDKLIIALTIPNRDISRNAPTVIELLCKK
jgi:hypothetical protein